MTEWLERIESSPGVTMFPTAEGRWQVSTRNADGSFRVHYGATLTDALSAAFPTQTEDDDEEDWSNLI